MTGRRGMIDRVKTFIRQHQLLDDGGLYLVALSGGADSVALLLVLHELHYRLHAVHCNFHLRGDESDRDETFCESLCARLDIPLHKIHFDTHYYAELHRQSIELAARELRYGYFEQLRMDLGAQGICVAHHRDDSVETILMNLVRGTGVHGLTGIKPRQGNILRPLLGVSRADIERFLAERGQPFVTDSTNLEDEATRNRVRHRLVPLLQQLNPKAVDNILLMAGRMAEVERVVDERLQPLKECSENALKGRSENALKGRREYAVDELLKVAPGSYMLYELLRHRGFNAAQCRQIYCCLTDGSTGRLFSSSDYDLLVDRGKVVVERRAPLFAPKTIPEPGLYIIGENEKLRVSVAAVTPDFAVAKSPQRITVDADKVRFPLTIRRVGQGDTMVPYGMKGHKLLSDMMTDRKMTWFEKRRQRVVVDAAGVTVWLVGWRCDNRVAVEMGVTQRILTIALE